MLAGFRQAAEMLAPAGSQHEEEAAQQADPKSPEPLHPAKGESTEVKANHTSGKVL